MRARTQSRRTIRRLAVVLGAAVAALLAVPAGASADPARGCTPTDVISATETEYTCYENPIDVAGYEVKQNLIPFVPKPPGDGYITRFETDVVDENGVPIPIDRLMLHHIVFSNLDKGDRTCTGNGIESFDGSPLFGPYAPERFAGAGEERAKLSLPPGYGYGLDAAHDWAIVYMLMNHKPVTDTAFIQYKLTVDTDPSIQPVRPYWLDVNNCKADPIYNVPGIGKRAARRAGPNPVHKRSASFTMQEDGWVVAGGGHVHGGARRLTINKPSCNDMQVAQSTPTWGDADHPFYNVRPVLHEPGPVGMSAFNSPTGIPVRDGQKLRLRSIYDNRQPHTRVMGIYVIYVAEDEPGGATPSECGGAPGDIAYGPGTDLTGRTTPVPFKVPLTGLDANGNAITIQGPPGRFRRLRSGAHINITTRKFPRGNVRLRLGSRLNYNFIDDELHNLTLANGPLGIGSPNLNGVRRFTQRFTRPGRYQLFCALHPVQMTQRIIVRKKRRSRR